MDVLQIIELLPTYDEIQHILLREREADYILKLAIKHIKAVREKSKDAMAESAEEVPYLLQCVVDKYWERIHTGHFSKVTVEIRQIFSLACFFKIFYNLFESSDKAQVEKCSELLDDCILVGCTHKLYKNSETLKQEQAQLFDNILRHSLVNDLPTIQKLPRHSHPCDIPQVNCPSVEHFRQHFYECQQPALLLNTIKHWPALEKWPDLNYILRIAGNRRVPIEIGSNYATDDWSQQLVKISDFLHRQFTKHHEGPEECEQQVEYLAQHELFDQIPVLKKDICIPDYCSLGSQINAVDIKAWLGPAGTTSPLHFDPKHNLLCQVFGTKKILLASPTCTENLYPHDTQFLGNTSQIDAENLDFDKYPLAAHVNFRQVTLQSGDCLYIPPKWWHYVKALAESFSVSFWWE